MSKHRDCSSSVVQIIAVLKNFNKEIWPLFRVACCLLYMVFVSSRTTGNPSKSGG
jgi:hypothetical protein